MLLETDEVRQYYLERAENDPLLQGIVAGKKTFTGCLDDCITGLKERGWVSYAEEGEVTPLQGFSSLIKTLSELSEEGLEVKKHYMNAEYLARYKASKTQCKVSVPIAIGALIGLLIPPSAAIEIFYFTVGALCSGVSGPPLIKGWKARRNPEKTFAPVYGAAQHHDSHIGRSFILEHFHKARPRFEQTYIALDQEERKEVDEQLHGYLRAGGIPGMDQNQLKDYLTGVLAKITPGS